jgi:hypothetical protein
MKNNQLHMCEVQENEDFLDGGYHGVAITNCWEEENKYLWVGNSEYSNTVNFCPFCGYKSQVVGIIILEEL